MTKVSDINTDMRQIFVLHVVNDLCKIEKTNRICEVIKQTINGIKEDNTYFIDFSIAIGKLISLDDKIIVNNNLTIEQLKERFKVFNESFELIGKRYCELHSLFDRAIMQLEKEKEINKYNSLSKEELIALLEKRDAQQEAQKCDK